jgi:hypothetical protein
MTSTSGVTPKPFRDESLILVGYQEAEEDSYAAVPPAMANRIGELQSKVRDWHQSDNAPRRCDVSFWHLADIDAGAEHVRSWEVSRHI